MCIKSYKPSSTLRDKVMSIGAFISIKALLIITVLISMTAYKANAQIYYVGVLAPQGESAAQLRWQPWLDNINSHLSEDTLVLVPLALENWQQQITAEQFALVLGPQVQFTQMDTLGWRWLATLQNSNEAPQLPLFSMADVKQSDFQTVEQYALYKQLENELVLNKQDKAAQINNEPAAMEQIASSLWVARNSSIQTVEDLRQRKLAAVDADAFSGYMLIAHLLQQQGLSTADYEVQFVGYPIELTLSTLASGAVDAAIAPLCLMEQMSYQGKINIAQYRLLNPVETDSNCQSSTKIYPNWTLAATAQAPAALLEQINRQLFVPIGPNAESQNAASTPQWLPPESSIDAERILYELNRHPSQQSLGVQILDWVKSHRWWVSGLIFIIVISMINYVWMSRLAWRRRRQLIEQNRLIRDYDQQLQRSERFAVVGEMSGAIAHEINQPLATIQNYAQGLLIRSQNKSAKPVDIEVDKEALNQQALEKQQIETALQSIVSETERVAAVVTNIRRWAGRYAADEVSVDIAATFEQCITFMGDKAQGIRFGYTSDYQRLQLPNLLLDQLLINTLLNAQQQDAKHIMLRCQSVDYKGAKWLALIMTDDGGGFDASRLTINQSANGQSQPFGHYATTSSKTEGLGLGLMICQRLCKSLGGMMQLNNVNMQQEFTAMRDTATYYQLKPTVNDKQQLNKVINSYIENNKTGAQIIMYLPLNLVDKKDSNNINSNDK
ncbi:MAG: PhnD/SsuA/transferrin family substrate-binding protein [Psychrobacter sp.]|nr:PhnD/SsuA/transferrin family substrate-binding protein [Psychrobacter sp.]